MIINKINELEREYQSLQTQMADPAVISNREQYRLLNRRYSELSEILNLWHKLQKIQKELDGARQMESSETDSELKELARQEVVSLEEKCSRTEKNLMDSINPPDPYDGKNIILEIRAGTGGSEAGLFAADLLRMYLRYAEKKAWKVEVLSESVGELDALKEIILLISGRKVYGTMKYESGVHRVQRVPVTEASGRIHTSAATVAVLPEAEDVEIEIDPAELRIDVFRSSGPGGQSVNTTDSAVRITHIPTGLVVSCQDEKSQHKNKAKALKILKSRLLDIAIQEQEERIARERRQMVSTGDRSAKIRTYNFPQNRLTDHRIHLNLHKLTQVMEGDLDDVIQALQEHDIAERLKISEPVSGDP